MILSIDPPPRLGRAGQLASGGPSDRSAPSAACSLRALCWLFLALVWTFGLFRPFEARAQSDDDRPARALPPILHEEMLTVLQSYDDNILLRPATRLSDWITRIAPEVRLWAEQGPVKLSLRGEAEVEFFQHHTELNTFDRAQHLDGALEVRLSPRFTLEASDLFIHSLDPFNATILGFGQVVERTEYFTNLLGGKAHYRLSALSTLVVYGSDLITTYRDPNLLNSNLIEVGAGLAVRLNPLDVMTPEYTFRNYSFERGPSFDASLLTLQEERRFSATLAGRLRAGAVFLREATSDWLVEFMGDAELTKTLNTATTFRVEIKRDLAVVGGFNGVFISNSFLLAMVRKLGENFTLSLSGAGLLQDSVFDSSEKLETYSVAVDVRYRVLSWLDAFFDYSYLRQDTHSTIPNIDDDRVVIGVAAHTPLGGGEPFRLKEPGPF